MWLCFTSAEFPVVHIQVSPDKLGFFQEDENGEVPPCPKLYEIMRDGQKTRSYQSGMAEIEPLMQKLSKLFNTTVDKLPKFSWYMFFFYCF